RFACARLSRPYRAGVISPTLPQRSPPSLLATAACGGLRSAPDCRTRRALPHLLYSCASPFGQALLVTQDPNRTWTGLKSCSAAVSWCVCYLASHPLFVRFWWQSGQHFPGIAIQEFAASSSSKTFACLRSGRSKPSLNEP